MGRFRLLPGLFWNWFDRFIKFVSQNSFMSSSYSLNYLILSQISDFRSIVVNQVVVSRVLFLFLLPLSPVTITNNTASGIHTATCSHFYLRQCCIIAGAWRINASLRHVVSTGE